jgi:hypothetical protein
MSKRPKICISPKIMCWDGDNFCWLPNFVVQHLGLFLKTKYGNDVFLRNVSELGLHGIIFQMTELFITTAVRKNPTSLMFHRVTTVNYTMSFTEFSFDGQPWRWRRLRNDWRDDRESWVTLYSQGQKNYGWLKKKSFSMKLYSFSRCTQYSCWLHGTRLAV